MLGKHRVRVAGHLPQRVASQRDAEPRPVRNRQHPIAVQRPAALRDVIHIGRPADIFDEIGGRHCRGELQIGGEADCGVPAVPDIFDPEGVGGRAIWICSEMPPTLVTSGCTMSRARLSSQGRKLCRRVMHSPVAIGTGLRSRNALKSSSASGFNGSSNQATS